MIFASSSSSSSSSTSKKVHFSTLQTDLNLIAKKVKLSSSFSTSFIISQSLCIHLLKEDEEEEEKKIDKVLM